MKFPLPRNLFPPLELSAHQEEQYEQLANELITSTLAEYDRFVLHDRKRVDSRRWKAVRSRDEVTIYRERASEAHPGPSALALYRSDSKSSLRAPNSTTNASSSGGGGSSRAALYRTMSFSDGHRFGLAETPKKPAHGPVLEDGEGDSDSDDTQRDSSEQTQRSAAGLAGAALAITDERDKSGALPRMLAVGALRGSLDDVMYGVVSPNASSVRLRSSYLGDDIADCAVLRELKRPSASDPFRFLGIKWLVRTKHRRTTFVLPRDFVVLEYSGVMLRPDNTRVGFHLLHSVEIPDCRELRELRILRAKVSSCYIYEETRSGRVDVFMTANVQPRGRVLERVALRSAATALSSCWQSVACAQSKKLAFCLQNDRPSATGSSVAQSTRSCTGEHALSPLSLFGTRRGSGEGSGLDQASQRSTSYSSASARRQCGVCQGKLGVLTKAARCQLCGEQVCHRCRLVRKLWTETLATQVTQSAVVFCKKCVASVSDESAMEIARQELWDTRAGARGRRTRASSADSTASSTTPLDVLSTERNTYLSVVLGRASDGNSDGGSSRGSTVSTSLNMSRRTSAGQPQDDVLGHSVGPSAPSKAVSYGLSGMGSLSTATGSTEALSLGDLECDAGAEQPSPPHEEPVMLDHRMTLTNRSLRHMDYVNLSDADLELKDDELESLAPSEASEEEDGEFRTSEASSVAVMDEDFDLRASETNAGEPTAHHDVAAIVEGAEPNETDKTDRSESEAKAKEEEEVEVVEAAPIAEVTAVLMSSSAQDDTSHLTNDDSGLASVTPRLRRALTAAPAKTSTAVGTAAYQSQLYQQMQDLHSVAESTYQVARANTEAVLADRDSGRLAKPTTATATSALRGVRTFSQPFAFNVVGLRSTRPLNVGMGFDKQAAK